MTVTNSVPLNPIPREEKPDMFGLLPSDYASFLQYVSVKKRRTRRAKRNQSFA